MDLSSFRMSKNFLLTTIPILSREQIKTEVSFNSQLKKKLKSIYDGFYYGVKITLSTYVLRLTDIQAVQI